MDAALCLLGKLTEEAHDEMRGDTWKGKTWNPTPLTVYSRD